MSSEIKADKWSPASGTSATIGDSGDTYTVPTGANFTVTDELKTNKISPASGTAFTLGDSGDTFTVPSGVTFANSGTATGFGEANTPSFGVRLSSDQTVANQSTTKLALATEDWDTNSAWNTSNYNFTVPSGEAGKYWFGGHVRILQIWGHDSTAYFSQLSIRKNDSNRAEHRIYDYSATTKDLDLQVFKVMNLAVGDVVDFRVYHNGAGQQNQNIASGVAHTYFAGFKVTS